MSALKTFNVFLIKLFGHERKVLTLKEEEVCLSLDLQSPPLRIRSTNVHFLSYARRCKETDSDVDHEITMTLDTRFFFSGFGTLGQGKKTERKKSKTIFHLSVQLINF